jgi:hypothetical protein
MGESTLEYHTPVKRPKRPALWPGVLAVVFALMPWALSPVDAFEKRMPPAAQAFLRWDDVFLIVGIGSWLLALLIGLTGMLLPRCNRLLPTLALLIAIVPLAAAPVIRWLQG